MTDVHEVVAVSMRAATGTPVPPVMRVVGISLGAVLRVVGAVVIIAIRGIRRRFGLGDCGGLCRGGRWQRTGAENRQGHPQGDSASAQSFHDRESPADERLR